METRLPLSLAALVALLAAAPADAAYRCFDDSAFPAAVDLAQREDGVRAVLAGPHLDADGKGPVVRFTDNGRWEQTAERRCATWECEPRPVDENCADAIPAIESEYGRRGISACVEHGGVMYFGLSAYQGEGLNETGGIGRYVPDTGKLEVRNPAPLQDKTVSELVFDGQYLWVASAYSAECGGGAIPGAPLARYHWGKDEWLPVENPGCGFAVFDMLLTEDAIWLATDMGITQIPRQPGDATEHYSALAPGAPQSISCTALYDRLLPTLPHSGGGADLYSPVGIVLDAIADRHPSYLRHYESKFTRRADELWKAMQSGDQAAVSQLAAAGVDPWYRTSGGKPVIIEAVQTGDIAALKTLASAITIDWSRDEGGWGSVLQRANKRPELFDWLVRHGAKADEELLNQVMDTGNRELFVRLLENGTLSSDYLPEPSIVHALKQDKPEYVELLLEHGLDPASVKIYRGADHPVVLAIEKGHGALAERLVDVPLAAGALKRLLELGKPNLVRELVRLHRPLGRDAVAAFEHTLLEGDAAMAKVLWDGGLEIPPRLYPALTEKTFDRALENGKLAAAEFIVDNGPELQDRTKEQMLEKALSKRNDAALVALLRRGFDHAVQNPALRRDLVVQGVRLGLREPEEIKNSADRTKLLVEALERGDEQLVVRLAPGAEVNKRRSSMGMALPTMGPEKMIECMRNRGSIGCYRGGSFLIDAAGRGFQQAVQALLDAGARQDLLNPLGATPLLVAAAGGHLAIVRQLVETPEADWADTDDLGNSALHYAAFGKHDETVEFIAGQAPELVNRQNNAGETPLHIAAQNGAAHVVKTLLARGADRDAVMWPARKVTIRGAFPDLPDAPGLKVERTNAQVRPFPPGGAFGGGMLVGSGQVSFGPPKGGKPSGPGKTALQLARESGHKAVIELLQSAPSADHP